MFDPAYIGVIVIGLLHGLEPGHGWPLAVMYSARKGNSLLSGLASSSIISLGHFTSSIAVVVAYLLFQSWLDFDTRFLKYFAAALLLILAYVVFREKANGLEKQHGHIHENQPEIEHEHEHEHSGQDQHTHWHKHMIGIALSIWGLASFAFILGFAHEEEFALLALVAGGANGFILMTSYGLSVTIGLIGITLVFVKMYKHWQSKFVKWEGYIPKISAAILVALAIVIVF